MRIRVMVVTALLFASLACSTVAPTPILMNRTVALNNETARLYKACSEGANYVPSKENALTKK